MVPVKEKLHAALWANIRYQGFLGEHTELANVIDTGVVGLLHWEGKNIF